jgi:hypothetical protein
VRADAVAPTGAAASLFLDAPIPTELRALLFCNAPILAEAGLSLPAAAMEILRRLSSDLPLASENRGVYLVSVSFSASLSDGRIITFAAAASPSAGS